MSWKKQEKTYSASTIRSTGAVLRNPSGGFTLVELIVVIAILGILAGVGTVAYSGYVKQANKAVDEQLFADLNYAVQLANYSNPALLDGKSGAIVLYGEEAGVPEVRAGDASDKEANQALRAALQAAIPDLDNARLHYDWQGRAMDMDQIPTIAKAMENSGLQALLDAGYGIGYAQSADYLWSEVSEAGQELSKYLNKDTEGNHYTPGELVVKAAGVSAADSFKINNVPMNMGSAWENESLMFLGDTQGSVGATSGIAAVVARDYAFAEYVKACGVEVSPDTIDVMQSWKCMASTFG